MRLRQLQAAHRGDKQYAGTDQGRHVRDRIGRPRAFGASWEVFALKNNNLVGKTMWSVRDAVDARLRNNSPSLKQRLFAGAHFGN
jgi:hypothetical protein